MEDEQKVVLFSEEAKMRRLKAEAVEKGDITDFSFLVGPDEGQVELMHCFKSDLLMASDYFRALLRSSLTDPPPVRIKHVQPHIFKLILRFITMHNIPELASIEDALAMSTAVDEFLLDLLVPFCKSEIERMITVETVWPILNKYHIYPQIHSICIKVLSSKARECIAHSTFLEASQESLLFFLQMEEMDITSEIDLFNACSKLAGNLPEEAGQELMKAVLPHLRLLTLAADEFSASLWNHLNDHPARNLIAKS